MFSRTDEREEVMGTGAFDCPQCECRRSYEYVRVVRFRSFPFFVAEIGTVREFVRCYGCRADYDLTVLNESSDGAPLIVPASWKLNSDPGAGQDRQVVELSEAAADELRRRMVVGRFDPTIAARIIPHAAGNGCEVRFDFPYSDGHDFLGRSRNIAVLVDRKDAEFLEGATVDFCDGQFRIRYAIQR